MEPETRATALRTPRPSGDGDMTGQLDLGSNSNPDQTSTDESYEDYGVDVEDYEYNPDNVRIPRLRSDVSLGVSEQRPFNMIHNGLAKAHSKLCNQLKSASEEIRRLRKYNKELEGRPGRVYGLGPSAPSLGDQGSRVSNQSDVAQNLLDLDGTSQVKCEGDPETPHLSELDSSPVLAGSIPSVTVSRQLHDPLEMVV